MLDERKPPIPGTFCWYSKDLNISFYIFVFNEIVESQVFSIFTALLFSFLSFFCSILKRGSWSVIITKLYRIFNLKLSRSNTNVVTPTRALS